MKKVQMISKKIWLMMILLLAVACTPGGSQPVEPPAEATTELPTAEPEQAATETITIWVGPETADCVGVAPQSCLQIKFEEDGEWQLFYDNIDGFDFVPGFAYELVVTQTTLTDVPADASSLRYELVEVVSETAVATEPTGSILDQLLGTDWDLTEWQGMTILPDTVPTLSFNESGIGGNAGCNGYGGSITLTGEEITISQLISTMMWCEGLMEQEQAFMQALQDAQSLSLDGETLILQTADATLTFSPPTQASLTDTQWILSGIAREDAVVSTLIDNDITAQFKDGNVTGSSGCNGYGGSYETDGTALTFGPTIGTLMACAEDDRNQRESEFLSALTNVAQYKITRNTLTLLDADGNLVMSFYAGSNAETN